MPQIAQLGEFYSSQIFWLLIFFGITFFVVGRGMVPKVMDTVASRDNTTATAQRLAVAQAGIDATIAGAEMRIADARRAAADDIEAVAADATRDIVSRVAGLTLDDAAVRGAVKENLVHG
jgi:F-type H+-transporting ATPase subunit b